MVISFIKQQNTRKEEGMIITSIKGITLSFPKDVVNVIDLGYLGVEKNFPEQKSSLSVKRRETKNYLLRKKSIIYYTRKRG